MRHPPPGPIFLIATLALLAVLVAPVLGVLAALPPAQALRTFATAGGDALRVSAIASAAAVSTRSHVS